MRDSVKLFLGDRIGDRSTSKTITSCNQYFNFLLMAEEVGFDVIFIRN